MDDIDFGDEGLYNRPRPVPASDRGGFSGTINYHTYNINSAGNINSGTNHGSISQDASGEPAIDRSHRQAYPTSPKRRLSLWTLLSIFIPAWPHAGEQDDPQTAPADAASPSRSDTAQSGSEMLSMDEPTQLPSASAGSPLYEVYVRDLLKHGYGLPCWQPKPSDPEVQPRGVVPGDIGTYTTEKGFKRMFNLFENETTIRTIAGPCHLRTGSQGLQGQINTSADCMGEDAVLSGEASIETPIKRLSENPLVDVLYEFRRGEDAGAILAMPTSADQEEINDLASMENFVRLYAVAIYRHAIAVRPLGENESLYIVTACIKSDSWAMAAYQGRRKSHDDTLQLSSILREGSIAPEYRWTKRCPSETRCGRARKLGVKDQSLFLRGFKLAFSSEFRSAVENGEVGDDAARADDPRDAKREGGSGRYDRQSRSTSKNGESSSSGTEGQSGSSRYTLSLDLAGTTEDNALKFTPFPVATRMPHHPSDVINTHILQETGCDIAICHDDAWCTFLEMCSSLVSDPLPLGNSPVSMGDSGERYICVQNGVAFLLPAESDQTELSRYDAQGSSPSQHPASIEDAPSALLEQLFKLELGSAADVAPGRRTRITQEDGIGGGTTSSRNAGPKESTNDPKPLPTKEAPRCFQGHVSEADARPSVGYGAAAKCYPFTRTAVRAEILTLIDRGEVRVIWISGPAGTGKTAIVGSIADECHARGWLAGSFFFSASSMKIDRSSKRFLIPTLAYHLFQLDIPGLPAAVLASIEANPSIFDKGLDEQAEVLLLRPIREVRREDGSTAWPKVVVVDGVDECAADDEWEYKSEQERQRSREDNQREIISALLHAANDPDFPFRIVIATRPQPFIQGLFSNLPSSDVKKIFLDSKYNPEADIKLYAQATLRRIGQEGSLPEDWYSQVVTPDWPKGVPRDVPAYLAEESFGQFVYVATVMRYVQGTADTRKKLKSVLNWRQTDTFKPVAALDALYTRIMQTSPKPLSSAIWICTLVGMRGVEGWLIKAVLESSRGETEYLLGPLACLITIADHRGDPDFQLYHKSLSDFLQDPRRSADLHVGFDEVRSFLSSRCFKIIKNRGPQVPLPANRTLDDFLEGFFGSFIPSTLLPSLIYRSYAASDINWYFSHLQQSALPDAIGAFAAVHKTCHWYSCSPACKIWRKGILQFAKANRWRMPKKLEILLDRFKPLSEHEIRDVLYPSSDAGRAPVGYTHNSGPSSLALLPAL